MSQPEQFILQEFLKAENDFISGKKLAENLNISRVAIWAQIEKLREAGFKIEARTGRGYRLLQMPEKLDPLSFKACMPERWQKIEIHFHKSIDSTNREAERLLAKTEKTPFIVAAREQTLGRGRLGREWFSADSQNLYLTFVFQPNLPPRKMQTFTLWMGASICDFLNRKKGIPVRLKWPNDLLFNGKKIGGILTEAKIDHDRMRDLLFGIGLNVNFPPADFPEEIRKTATSLSAGGKIFPLNEFAAEISTTILDGFLLFLEDDRSEKLQQLWKIYDALDGLPITARQGNKTFSGIGSGIDDSGSLLLLQPDGSTQTVTAGDVTLRKESG